MMTGLLHKASDDRLRAVLAHELSHQDLNHVAKAWRTASCCCAAPAIRRK